MILANDYFLFQKRRESYTVEVTKNDLEKAANNVQASGFVCDTIQMTKVTAMSVLIKSIVCYSSTTTETIRTSK